MKLNFVFAFLICLCSNIKGNVKDVIISRNEIFMIVNCSGNESNIKRLKEELMTRRQYDKHIRPVKDHRTTILIHTAIYISRMDLVIVIMIN